MSPAVVGGWVRASPWHWRSPMRLFTSPGKFGEQEWAAVESPEYAGRMISSLFTDPDLLSKSGKVYIATELGDVYGLEDVDGNKPSSLKNYWWGPMERS